MTAVKLDNQVVETGVGDETVLLHLASGMYFGLDAVGTFIWTQIKQGLPLTVIRDSLVEEFDVSSEQAAADLDQFVAELRRQGIAEGGDAPAGN